MKTRVVSSLLLVLVAGVAFARKPPETVQKMFKEKFPNATQVSWIIEEPAVWEAFFTINGIKASADFTVGGIWLETETEAKLSDLPKPAVDKLLMESTDWSVEEVYKVETRDSALLYSVDLKKGLVKKVVAFNEDGSPVVYKPQ